MTWLTDELKAEVRSLFEPRYKRKLTDDEVVGIANNLTEFIKTFLKFKWRLKHESKQN